MPIEDIDFLKRNSKKESYVFLIDSAERDRDLYPTPSSYVINFTSPFQYVVGLDVVDASIPRTQYNVDLYNNTLRFMIHDDTLLNREIDTSKMKSVNIEPGDYSIQTLIPKLNEALQDYVMTSNYESRDVLASQAALGCNVLFDGIFAETYSSPPETTNLIKLTCPYPFVFDMKGSTMAESLGFDLYTQTGEATRAPLERRYTAYESSNMDNRKVYHSVDIDPKIPPYTLGKTFTLFEGPRGIIDRAPIPVGATVAQSFYVSKARTYLSAVSAALAGVGTVRWRINPDIGGSGGQPGIATVAQGTIKILESDGALSPSPDVPKPAVLLTRGRYWISFTVTSPSTSASLLYNDVVGPTELLKTRSSNDSAWSTILIGDTNATASITIVTSDEYHTMVGPGTYNFIGERYIILRCPEIEENS